MTRNLYFSFTWFLLFLLTNGYIFGQKKRAAHWYFGHEAGIDFSSGNGVADTSGKLISIEGSCSISDLSGNLLFYSNGLRVFNRKHEVMSNSTGLVGDESAQQSSIIVPQPNNTSNYYLFNTRAGFPDSGLVYSVVDMTLNGGFGDVTTTKNRPLHDSGTEELAATRHCNEVDYWVLSRQQITDIVKFNCYLLTANGVEKQVVSTFNFSNPENNSTGSLTFSQDGSVVSWTTFLTCVYIFDFNKQTGQLTFRDSISHKQNEYMYSNALSPDGKKLYTTSWLVPGYSLLSQFDLSAPNITGSRIDLDSVDYTQGSPNGFGFIGQVRLAPDQRIYASRWNQLHPFQVHPDTYYSLDSIDVINTPNQPGLACNIQRNFLYLNHKPTMLGLPNFVSNFTADLPIVITPLAVNAGPDISACPGTVYKMGTAPYPNINYSWFPVTGLSDPTISNPSISLVNNSTTVLTYSYILKATKGCSTAYDTVVVTVQPRPRANFAMKKDNCPGEQVLFKDLSTTTFPDVLKKWEWEFSNNQTASVQDPFITFTTPGLFYATLTVTNGVGCTADTTLSGIIRIPPKAEFSFTDNCLNTSISFKNSSIATEGNIVNYNWNFGDSTFATVPDPKKIFISCGAKNISLIIRSDYGCSDTIIKSITIFDTPLFNFHAADTARCPVLTTSLYGKSLPGSDNIVSWKWLLGSNNEKTGQVIQVSYTQKGTYTVTLIATTINGCTDTLVKKNYITIYAAPTASFSVLPAIITEDEPEITLTDKSSTDVVKWQWDLGDGTTALNKTTITHLYNTSATTYTIRLIVSNQLGCSDSTTEQVLVKQQNLIFIPNAFTPDGNNRNEVFKPVVSGAFASTDFFMQIFDRWGSQILYTGDANKGWDGTHKGQVCENDVYVYRITFGKKSSNEPFKEFKGIVTLVH